MNPDQYTNKEFYLDVGDGHQLYVHDWGNPKGLPILHLHGGPGSGTSDSAKRNFDPSVHRVIFHDQRGAGKSLPYGSLANNTAADLVEDIEKIAKHLGLDTFVIHGGSWGSTLALAYSLKYPQRIKALVLFGIWTGAQAEIDYIEKGRFATHFPDVWQTYLEATPESHRSNPGKYHLSRILGDDEQAARESAITHLNMEGGIVRLDDRFSPNDPSDPMFDYTFVKIEAHYLVNHCFMPDRYIMDRAHKLDMPVWLVQGRYDMVCPPAAAYELHQKLPNSKLIWTIGGHIGSDRETNTVMRTILLQLAEKG